MTQVKFLEVDSEPDASVTFCEDLVYGLNRVFVTVSHCSYVKEDLEKEFTSLFNEFPEVQTFELQLKCL